jgi:hypothetical protein
MLNMVKYSFDSYLNSFHILIFQVAVCTDAPYFIILQKLVLSGNIFDVPVILSSGRFLLLHKTSSNKMHVYVQQQLLSAW